jgi:hypothetical protein
MSSGNGSESLPSSDYGCGSIVDVPNQRAEETGDTTLYDCLLSDQTTSHSCFSGPVEDFFVTSALSWPVEAVLSSEAWKPIAPTAQAQAQDFDLLSLPAGNTPLPLYDLSEMVENCLAPNAHNPFEPSTAWPGTAHGLDSFQPNGHSKSKSWDDCTTVSLLSNTMDHPAPFVFASQELGDAERAMAWHKSSGVQLQKPRGQPWRSDALIGDVVSCKSRRTNM